MSFNHSLTIITPWNTKIYSSHSWNLLIQVFEAWISKGLCIIQITINKTANNIIWYFISIPTLVIKVWYYYNGSKKRMRLACKFILWPNNLSGIVTNINETFNLLQIIDLRPSDFRKSPTPPPIIDGKIQVYNRRLGFHRMPPRYFPLNFGNKYSTHDWRVFKRG